MVVKMSAPGRKLEKPVCHYSLSWAKDEKPDRQEMRWAAQESLKALGMERHQALVVSHRDGQPHVHVIANRVDPESGKAARSNGLSLRYGWRRDEFDTFKYSMLEERLEQVREIDGGWLTRR